MNKSILENALIHAQAFLEKKDTSSITSHIFFEATQGSLTIKATDFEIGLEIITQEVNTTEDGSVTANGKKLLDIVKILKDGEILLESNNDILHIQQGRSNFKLPTYNSKEFPAYPSYENKPQINIDARILIESLKKITPAIDTNNPKFELNGTLIDIKNESIFFVSTDTRRLALVDIAQTDGTELSIIIPKKAIVEIQKLFFDNIEIFYDETHLIIKSNEYTFFTKLINGKFPDYTRIIPKEITYNLVLPKAQMIDAIKQITTISADMKLTFINNNIIFESLNDDNIEAKTILEFPTPFTEDFIIAINSRYLLDFLSQINHSEFSLGLNDANLPFVLRDANFKTIVMPIVI